MKANATYISYRDTHSFSNLVIDYVDENEHLKAFISEFPSIEAIGRQLERKKLQALDRVTLVDVLNRQYQGLELTSDVRQHIDALQSEHTFTICTAHQPNVFTGYLYFIYKIIHAINLAKECKTHYPEYHFIPVYYMGSEDNDIDEIGTFHYNEKTYTWKTNQKGACGRMKTHELKDIVQVINRTLNKDVNDEAFLMTLLEQAYDGEHTLAEATRIIVNALFGQYGLLVIDGDDVQLKTIFKPVIRHELLFQDSQTLVLDTLSKLSSQYKVQANPRAINLFYLNENLRERIEFSEGHYQVVNTSITFSKDEMEVEIEQHPERFSPNVILRPLYQETILPNVAFIGGGGELAYWLELKTLFEKHQLVYPLILLRNSVLWINEKTVASINKLSMPLESVFLSNEMIFKQLIQESNTMKSLQAIIRELDVHYDAIISLGESVSPNLSQSMSAHKAKASRITNRMIQKFNAQLKTKEELTFKKIAQVKQQIAPNGHLQERYDNFLSVYKTTGLAMLVILSRHQQAFGKEFLVLKLQGESA